MTFSRYWRQPLLAAAAVATLTLGGGGALGKTKIADFPPSLYAVAGAGWAYHDLNLTNNAQCDRNGGPCALPLGFSINFGAGPVDTLYVSENGVVTFGAALPEGDAGNGSLNVRDYIAALYTDLISIDEPEDALGEITWAPGRIDPTEDPALDDDTSPLSWFQGERGFKIDWHGVTRGSGERVYLQIAILDRPGNDFDLQINHGYLPNTVMQRQGAKVGFKLGANFFQLNGGAIDNAQNLEFQFRNGACMNC